MGRHRRRRSWFWAWFPTTLTALWLSILISVNTSHPPVAFQRAWTPPVKPVHIIRLRALQPPRLKTTARLHTVTSGETLWTIARKYCGNGSDYKHIMNVNGIKTWTITPGEKIKVDC